MLPPGSYNGHKLINKLINIIKIFIKNINSEAIKRIAKIIHKQLEWINNDWEDIYKPAMPIIWFQDEVPCQIQHLLHSFPALRFDELHQCIYPCQGCCQKVEVSNLWQACLRSLPGQLHNIINEYRQNFQRNYI